MRKKYILNGRFLTQSTTGVQRYAVDLVKALDMLIDCGLIDSNHYSFCLLSPKNVRYDLNLKHIPLRQVGHFKGHFWEQIELPLYAHDGFLINLCNTAPLLKFNQVVTIHDASVYGFPQAYSIAFRIWYKLLFKWLGATSRKIVTDSAFSKEELAKYCGIKKDKMHVVYLGKEHILAVRPDDSILRRHDLMSKRFVLAVSSMNPNKNFKSIVQAMELLGSMRFDTVIAGGTNPNVFSRSDVSLSDNVRHVGYVSDGELRALYEHASCFVYPSFYEGFGLPPLEAMACGCPVLVSQAASLPEVCGDAALYCDPHDPEDIAEKIRLLMSDEALRAELRQKGLERAMQFTWDKCAKETMAVIREALN